MPFFFCLGTKSLPEFDVIVSYWTSLNLIKIASLVLHAYLRIELLLWPKSQFIMQVKNVHLVPCYLSAMPSRCSLHVSVENDICVFGRLDYLYAGSYARNVYAEFLLICMHTIASLLLINTGQVFVLDAFTCCKKSGISVGIWTVWQVQHMAPVTCHGPRTGKRLQ